MSDRFRFDAAAVLEDVNLGLLTAIIAENGDGTGVSLAFQAQLTQFDEQDIALGQDKYCVIVNGGSIVYGGVVSVTSRSGVMDIELNDWAAEELGVDRHFECLVNVPEDLRKSYFNGVAKVLSIAPDGQKPRVVL